MKAFEVVQVTFRLCDSLVGKGCRGELVQMGERLHFQRAAFGMSPEGF